MHECKVFSQEIKYRAYEDGFQTKALITFYWCNFEYEFNSWQTGKTNCSHCEIKSENKAIKYNF